MSSRAFRLSSKLFSSVVKYLELYCAYSWNGSTTRLHVGYDEIKTQVLLRKTSYVKRSLISPNYWWYVRIESSECIRHSEASWGCFSRSWGKKVVRGDLLFCVSRKKIWPKSKVDPDGDWLAQSCENYFNSVD